DGPNREDSIDPEAARPARARCAGAAGGGGSVPGGDDVARERERHARARGRVRRRIPRPHAEAERVREHLRHPRGHPGAQGVNLERWEVCAAPPGAPRPDGGWIEATVPTTAAAGLRAAGLWSLDAPPRRFDAEDWWWRCRFARPGDGAWDLCLDGVATVATVWLN